MKIRKITKAYIFALAIIALISVSAFVILDSMIYARQDDASLVNISGRQRMLSQRSALFALQLVNSKNDQDKNTARENLRQTLQAMQAGHEKLVNVQKPNGMHTLPTTLQQLYFEKPVNLNEKTYEYLRLLKKLMTTPNGQLENTDEYLDTLLNISSTEILPALDQAVSLFEAESTAALVKMRLWQKIVLLGLLSTLVLEGFLIFKPLEESIRARSEELVEAKKEAEKIAQFPINNPNPLIHINKKGEIIIANPAAALSFPGIFEDGFQNIALAGLESCFGTMDFDNSKKAGSVREIHHNDIVYEQTITPVITDGEPALVLYCHDITAIKHAQEKARLLEAAIISAKDAVIITSGDLAAPGPEILYVNQAFTRISGYEPEEVIGKSPRLLQGSDTDRRVLDKIRETLMAGKSFKGELKNYTKDGIAYWLDISIVPVKNEHGAITHYAAIERDITERKAFEKELTITKEAAQVASRAKDDFLANMSHELRTPMNGIIGLSELLLDMDMNEEQYELADAINSSSRNLLILLNDILDLSKIEAGELSLENMPFDLRRTVRQTIDLLKPLASRKGVVLESTINPIVPDFIIGDPARLQQIMNNLISNAVKFTDVGYVRLDMTSKHDTDGAHMLQFRVEDSGIGIPEDKRETIFNKFTQADVSTARKYGGTGLGLAITRELVEIMGGEITVDSAEGRGTTFYVKIPTKAAQKDETDNKEAQTKPIKYGYSLDKKLMIVDDHPVNLLFIRKVLKSLGFKNVVEAHSGKEALDLYEKGKFDLIFMDCQMPEIDGFEASAIIREIEEFENQTKIIAVTADAMKGAREKCIDAGMNDYISKPVDVEKLKMVLSEWIPGEQSVTSEKEYNIYLPVQSDTAPESDFKILDRARLELFTDGDPDEERALIEMFTTYAEESLEILQAECDSGDNEIWKKAAHKLKGSAANLGAELLSDICYTAEKSFEENSEIKAAILSNILACYRNVCAALKVKEPNI